MFNLEEEIGRWRSEVSSLRSLRGEVHDELECHLRDEIDHFLARGASEQEAFLEAVQRLGAVEDLSVEFSKVPLKWLGFGGWVGSEVIAMDSRSLYRNELFATLLFFVGLSGVVGWVATTVFMLRGWTNSGHWATWLVTFRTIGLFALWSSFFLVFTAIGLPLGVRLLRECERKKKILVRAMVPAVMLSPVYAVFGVGAILTMPFLVASGSAILSGPDIVKSANSPDGNYEAYVVDYPALDGPDQSLVIDRKDGVHFLEIADLPEDIDSIKEIHWSPQSDIVVFQTWRNLYVVTVPSYKTVSIYLGREWRRKSPNRQSTFSSGGVRLEVTDIAFPEPGVVTYRIKGASEAERLEVGSFLK